MKYNQQIFNPKAWSQEDLQKKQQYEDKIIMFERLASQRYAFDKLTDSYQHFHQMALNTKSNLDILITHNNGLNIPIEIPHSRSKRVITVCQRLLKSTQNTRSAIKKGVLCCINRANNAMTTLKNLTIKI